jgi:hypothetical protein
MQSRRIETRTQTYLATASKSRPSGPRLGWRSPPRDTANAACECSRRAWEVRGDRPAGAFIAAHATRSSSAITMDFIFDTGIADSTRLGTHAWEASV